MQNIILSDLRQSAYDETDNLTPEYSQEEIIAAMRANCIERRDLLTQSLELADYRADMDDDERHSVRVALFLRIEDMQREWDALHEQLQAMLSTGIIGNPDTYSLEEAAEFGEECEAA